MHDRIGGSSCYALDLFLKKITPKNQSIFKQFIVRQANRMLLLVGLWVRFMNMWM